MTGGLARVALGVWLAAGLVAGGAVAAAAPFKTGVLEPPRPAPDFALKNADGGEFRLARQRGHVVALAFGYTFCADVCPTTLAELATVKARLGPESARTDAAPGHPDRRGR
jgi:protein SCO1/2